MRRIKRPMSKKTVTKTSADKGSCADPIHVKMWASPSKCPVDNLPDIEQTLSRIIQRIDDLERIVRELTKPKKYACRHCSWKGYKQDNGPKSQYCPKCTGAIYEV